MATLIYSYFEENFGLVDSNIHIEFQGKYENFSTKDLKKVLKKLKSENGDILEIKFVAKRLRNLLNKSDNSDHNFSHNNTALDHDSLMNKTSGVTSKDFSQRIPAHFSRLACRNVRPILPYQNIVCD